MYAFARAYAGSLAKSGSQLQGHGMMTLTELAYDPAAPLLTSFDWQWLRTWPASRARPASTQSPTCAATWPGAPSAAWTHWQRSGGIWNCTSGDAGGPPVQTSTVSRRFSVTAGFYRTCVLDSVMQHSPAEHVRRPRSLLNIFSQPSWPPAPDKPASLAAGDALHYRIECVVRHNAYFVC
jgi:hypothetical protein